MVGIMIRKFCQVLDELSRIIILIFPIHPRTLKNRFSPSGTIRTYRVRLPMAAPRILFVKAKRPQNAPQPLGKQTRLPYFPDRRGIGAGGVNRTDLAIYSWSSIAAEPPPGALCGRLGSDSQITSLGSIRNKWSLYCITAYTYIPCRGWQDGLVKALSLW